MSWHKVRRDVACNERRFRAAAWMSVIGGKADMNTLGLVMTFCTVGRVFINA
jgi:hypothetical protein